MDDCNLQYIPVFGIPAACTEFARQKKCIEEIANEDVGHVPESDFLGGITELCNSVNYSRAGVIVGENLAVIAGLAYVVL